MRITDHDYANHTEAAQIVGIALIAALRNGRLTAKQEAKINQILAKAERREAGGVRSSRDVMNTLQGR